MPQPTSIHFVFFFSVFMLISRQIKKSKCGLRWVEGGLRWTSTHFNPLCSFYFIFMSMSSEIQKSKSGLRWVEVNLNPPQPTL